MNKKPSLLLVADTFHPKVDGTLKFMEEFAKRSHSLFDITYLVPELTEVKSYSGDQVVSVKTSKRISLSGYPLMKLTLKNLKVIKAAIKKSEIVFIQGPALISYLSIYYAHKYGKITIFYTHTIAWELFEKFAPPLFNKLLNKLVKWLSIISYNCCSLLLVPYPRLEQYLKQSGVNSTIKVAKLGVDIVNFSPALNKNYHQQKLGLPPEKKVIGYVGRISKEKNTKILLEAFKKLEPAKDFYLLLVGDGPADQTEPFKQIQNCQITGFKSEVNPYLKAMNVFVMPSLTETTSLATLEAMATGIPVIVSKVGFMKDYVKRDYNGQFFPKNSSKILAAKIMKLVKDSELSERLGQNARRTVIYSFSWERSINRIKRLIFSQYQQEYKALT